MVKVLNYIVCEKDSQDTVRVLSILSALILSMMGLALVYLGIQRYAILGNILDAIGEKYVLVALSVTAIGVLTFLAAFMGILALLIMGYNMVMAYFYLALFMFMVQLAFGGFIVIDGQDECKIKRSLFSNMQPYAVNSSSDRGVMNFMEAHMHCCGVITPWDYTSCGSGTGVLTIGPHDILPRSCCKERAPCFLGEGTHWTSGCLDQTAGYVYNSLHRMGTVLMCSSTVAGLSAAFVFVYGNNMKKAFTII